MLQYKPNFEESKKYWRAFWEKEVLDRPVVCVKAPKRGVEYHPFELTPAMSYYACMEDGWDATLAEIKKNIASTWFGGEAMPQVDLTLGPDEYAAILGGKLQSQRDNFTSWSIPVWDDMEGRIAQIDRSENGYFSILRGAYRKLAEEGDGIFLLNMLDFHSHFDALCALRDPAETCMDLLDDPDSVVAALDSIAATYPEIFEAIYEDARMEERGCIGWCPTYLEKGRSAIVCCDYSCLLSPAQGKKFFLPYVEQEVAYIDQ